MALITKEYTLDAAAVEAVSAELQAYLKKRGVDRLNVHRLRLSVEEILLNVMANCGENTRITIGIGKQYGQHPLYRCPASPVPGSVIAGSLLFAALSCLRALPYCLFPV